MSDCSLPLASRQSQQPEAAGFIVKTFDILGLEDYSKIIYWSPSGQEFMIRDVDKFEELVLPRYFRHNKMNSFVRQLNMYGFHKIKHNHFKSTFKHPHFKRAQPELLPLIRRKPKPENENGQGGAENGTVENKEQNVTQPPVKPTDEMAMEPEKINTLTTQQFLGTTRMINMSLVKVSCADLAVLAEPEDEDDCASIEGELQAGITKQDNQGVQFFDFQDPACFLASSLNINFLN